MSWLDDLNRLLAQVGKPPVAPIAPRDRSLRPTEVTGPGTPAILPGKGQPQAGGPTPFPDISPTDVAIQKYNARYRRMLALGQAPGISDYMGVAFPAVIVGRLDPEYLFPDDLLLMGLLNVATGGANFARATLVNPIGSGVVGVVTRVSATAGAAAQNFQFGVEAYSSAGLAQPTVSLRGTLRDLRGFGSSSTDQGGKCFIHLDTNNAAQFQNGPIMGKGAPANTSVEWLGSNDDPVAIVTPGTGLVIVPSVGAASLLGDIEWREGILPVVG